MITDDEPARASFDRAAQTEHAAYREQVATIFPVEQAAGPVPLRLATVSDEHVANGFRHFSLYFHGPPDRLLPQGIYEACFSRRAAADDAQPAAGGAG